MGSLTPGATYTYEHEDGVTYATELGQTTRKEIGRMYDSRTSDGRPIMEHVRDSKLWGDIHRAAKTNPTLQSALDHVIMIYKLSKEYNDV